MPVVQHLLYKFMMKIRLACLLSLMLLALACTQKQSTDEANHYSINGKTSEMPDGTMLYLTETLSNQIVDSIKDKLSLKLKRAPQLLEAP